MEQERPNSKARSRKISLFKTLSWRIVGTIDTFVISFFIAKWMGLDHQWEVASSIASVEVVTKMILYYFHERAWNRFL